jgi:hypothetical protein
MNPLDVARACNVERPALGSIATIAQKNANAVEIPTSAWLATSFLLLSPTVAISHDDK